ncbi:hypothetical protein BD779DRAFT_1681568 [Infundibulicybe gibba]|nr:hypothetical protein BD779DRAFT_1681568 [Infundibulicybe gibba]
MPTTLQQPQRRRATTIDHPERPHPQPNRPPSPLRGANACNRMPTSWTKNELAGMKGNWRRNRKKTRGCPPLCVLRRVAPRGQDPSRSRRKTTEMMASCATADAEADVSPLTRGSSRRRSRLVPTAPSKPAPLVAAIPTAPSKPAPLVATNKSSADVAGPPSPLTRAEWELGPAGPPLPHCLAAASL